MLECRHPQSALTENVQGLRDTMPLRETDEDYLPAEQDYEGDFDHLYRVRSKALSAREKCRFLATRITNSIPNEGFYNLSRQSI